MAKNHYYTYNSLVTRIFSTQTCIHYISRTEQSVLFKYEKSTNLILPFFQFKILGFNFVTAFKRICKYANNYINKSFL